MSEPERYSIVINEYAIQNMLLAGIETALVKPLGQNRSRPRPWEGNEVDGHLWGHTSNEDAVKYFVINNLSVSVSSHRTECSVQYSAQTLEKQQTTIKSLWPETRLIGHFHTHPYMHLYDNEIEEQHYTASPEDLDVIKNEDEKNVYIIMTIAKRKESDPFADYPLSERDDFSVIKFPLGDLCIWISARSRRNNSISLAARKKVYIKCPSIFGMVSPEAPDREQLTFWRRAHMRA